MPLVGPVQEETTLLPLHALKLAEMGLSLEQRHAMTAQMTEMGVL